MKRRVGVVYSFKAWYISVKLAHNPNISKHGQGRDHFNSIKNECTRQKIHQADGRPETHYFWNESADQRRNKDLQRSKEITRHHLLLLSSRTNTEGLSRPSCLRRFQGNGQKTPRVLEQPGTGRWSLLLRSRHLWQTDFFKTTNTLWAVAIKNFLQSHLPKGHGFKD